MGKLRACLFCLVIFHGTIIVFNGLSFFFLIFFAPWYIALPCCTMIGRVLFTNTKCPLTALENIIRGKIGLPTIESFAAHYFLWKKRS